MQCFLVALFSMFFHVIFQFAFTVVDVTLDLIVVPPYLFMF